MFTLNMLKAFYWRALSVDILVYILLFSIKLQFIPLTLFVFFFCFFFVNCVMVFFAFFVFFFFFFFFFFFTKCTVLNGDVANKYVLGL